jgi:hypothetical protein
MSKFEGAISATGLPPHRGLIVNLCFYAVPGPDAPVPYNGDPPAGAATDCEQVFEEVDLDKESQQTTFEHHFSIERQPGYYYVQVRIILFRRRENGSMVAQAEQFFFARRPFHIDSEPDSRITFPVAWPAIPLETLHHYDTITPQAKRPWWRFW